MKSNSSKLFSYWTFFALNNQEELYNIINGMITENIKEVAPKVIKDYLSENLNTDFIIRLIFEGKEINSSRLKEEIIQSILHSF